MRLILGILLLTAFVAVPAPAAAHEGNDVVYLYNPITDGDGDHGDVSAWWAWGYEVSPPAHHIVYANWGVLNDWSMDVFARAPGRHIVTPFAARTSGGHVVSSTVVGIAPGCASGSIADGGYRVTVEARDTVTGEVLARAELMHVDRPQVGVGQQLGGWTTIGFTSRFRYSSCYQVSNDAGIHVHFEVINRHRYACWTQHGYGAALTELTAIGAAATHHAGQRARC